MQASRQIECRAALKADLPEVLRLYAQSAIDHGRVLDPGDAEKLFDRLARYPDYSVHVAIRDGRIVGSFALLIMDNLAHQGAPSAVIEDVAVDPQLQGQGIGQAMLRHALRLCGARGCHKAALSSNLKRERARAFYQWLGFERHGYSYRVIPVPSLPADAAPQGPRG